VAVFTGSSGNDVYTGGLENDQITGNGGNDTLSGNGGNDDIAGGAGADVLEGGDGDDVIYSFDRSPAFILPYYNNPYSPPLLDTGSSVDVLNGGAGDDRLFAGYGDQVDGGADGFQGDYLYISFLGAPSGVTVDFRQPTQTIGGGTITNVEHVSWVQGSNFDDDINVGSWSNNGYTEFTAVFGAGGNDHLTAGYYTGVLYGEDGNDVLDGRGSQYLQRVDGGAGDDILYTNANTFAAAYGGDGNDTIYSHDETHGGSGDDLIELQSSYYGGRVYGDDGDDIIYAAQPASPGAGAVISGGAGADILNGNAVNDVLASGDLSAFANTPVDDMGVEHDQLFGNDGDDVIAIGYGDDADGGAGNDILYLSLGGALSGVTVDLSNVTGSQPFSLAGGTIKNFESIPHLTGSAFDDNITVGTQTSLLKINGASGNDTVIASGSSVEFNGGEGDDWFVSGISSDTFDGGNGFDTIDYSYYSSAITVNLGILLGSPGSGPSGDSFLNIEQVIGSGFDDAISGDNTGDTLSGGGGNDTLNGNGGNDSLAGGAGNDQLNGGIGADTMSGGSGNDSFVVDNSGDQVLEGAGGGTDTINASVSWSMAAGQQIEVLTATGFGAIDLAGNELANTLNGNEAANRLNGLGGADTLNGGGGDDTLDGGTGNDQMTGGIGSDIYYVDSAGDVVTELSNEGTDTVRTTLLTYALGANVENLEFIGTGNAALTGNSLANTITGGTGADTMIGGTGNDTYVVENSGDAIIENVGQGTDTVLVSTATGLTSYSLSSTAEIELLKASDPSSTVYLDLTGNDFSQRIEGNNGSNHLFGGRGDDVLYGFDGEDNLAGVEGADTMVGGRGNDYYNVDNVGDMVTELANEGVDQVTSYLSEYTLPDNVEVLRFGSACTLAVGNASDNDILANGTLRGLGGNDLLVGLSGNDILEGGNGNDVLTGGLGTDLLTGGAGSDVFRDTAAGLNGDTIADVALGEHITITDVNLATFHYQLSGSVLTYSGGTLIFQNAPVGHFIATAAAGGGVDLTLKSTVHNDFNGDGRSDILWRSDGGALSDWLANANGGFASNDGNAYTTAPTNWHIAGTGDFNGDGRSDILWRNNDGSLSDWLATPNGGFAANDANAFTKVSTSWHVVSTGDFNGDGREDLLWRSDSGALSDWLANANGGFTSNDTYAYTTVSTSWKVAGTGDFNGDGREDILWRSDSGALSDWLANANGGFASNDANAYTTAPTSWKVAGTGDFNGDGREDILWRSDSGALSDWLANANGGFTSNDANAYATVPTSWHIAGTGDYNGDGREDILWRSDSGALSNWLANANGGFAANDANAHAQASTDWHIQAHDYLIV